MKDIKAGVLYIIYQNTMICDKVLLPFICLLGLSSALNQDDPTIVTLPEGQIRGHVLKTPNDKEYYAFQEIPYAAPPVGKLRFQAPVPHDKWDGVLDTTQNTKICYQSATDFVVPDVIQTEDCLYLYVYTPVAPGNTSATLLPVLVWIPGGGFQSGTGAPQLYKPYYLVEREIVIVSINYRVGTLGFLATEDGVIPGNIGLRDQNLALQWVKKNIELFGGDPEKVTISGESAGGISVGHQLISKRSKGLFRAAILQSGSPLCAEYQAYPRFYAFELGRNLNSSFTSNDSEELLKLLQSFPASDIINNTVPVSIGKENGIVEAFSAIWLPVIEDANLEDTFLTGPFHDDIKNGNINQVPTLIGYNSEEMIFFLISDPLSPYKFAQYFDNDVTNVIRNTFNMTKENKLIAAKKIREVYTDGLFQDDAGQVVKFLSDSMFIRSIIRHAKLQSNYTDVYLYQFSYQGEMPGMKIFEVAGVRGVSHTEDLAYLWDTIVVPNPNSNGTAEDLLTRDRLLTLWSNFVKYLNPTPEKDTLLENVIWEKVTPNNLVYLNINDTLDVRTNPREYLNLEKVIDEYALPPLITY